MFLVGYVACWLRLLLVVVVVGGVVVAVVVVFALWVVACDVGANAAPVNCIMCVGFCHC